MGQEASTRRKRGGANIPLDKETLLKLRDIKEKTNFEDGEIQKLFVIFEELVGEKQALNRDEFQQALGNLADYDLAKFKGLPMGVRLFDVLDKNKDGLLDLQEFFLGMSLLCHGSDEAKIDLTFKVFDRDGNGFITQDELKEMYITTYQALMNTLRTTLTPPEFVENAEANKFQDKLIHDLQKKFEGIMQGVAKNIMREMDKSDNGKLTKEEFKEFVLANPFVKASYQLKFTKDSGQPAYQDDEKVTAEVLLSFLPPSDTPR